MQQLQYERPHALDSDPQTGHTRETTMKAYMYNVYPCRKRYQCIYLPTFLSVCSSIHHLSIYLSIYLHVYHYLSFFLPIPASLSTYLSTYLPFYLSLYLSIQLSICKLEQLRSMHMHTYIPTYTVYTQAYVDMHLYDSLLESNSLSYLRSRNSGKPDF